MIEQCFFDLLKQIRDYAEECNDFAKNHKKKTFSLLTGRWKHAIISSVRKVDPFGESRNLRNMTGCSAVW